MSMKSVALATMGATAGFVAGNYLYNLDKEANKYKEVPVPFYTVRKVAEDISKETKKMVDDIKAKCCKNAEEVIADACGGEIDTIYGIAINENLGDAVIVTVIATGFDEYAEEPVVVKPTYEPQVQQVKPTTTTTPNVQKSEPDIFPKFFTNK